MLFRNNCDATTKVIEHHSLTPFMLIKSKEADISKNTPYKSATPDTHNYCIAKKQKTLGKIPVLDSNKTIKIGTINDVIVSIPDSLKDKIKIDIIYDSPLSCKVKKGDIVAKIRVTLDNGVVFTEHNLEALNEIKNYYQYTVKELLLIIKHFVFDWSKRLW